ncbi:MAG: Cys-tRNA(Pro) deacylase [Acutalibacteraceae bacterium]
MSESKTNAMRILDKAKVSYLVHSYDASDGNIDGASVAQKTGMEPSRVYKTLVTRGNSKAYYVFVLPVLEELNLKKAAAFVKEKSVEMLHVKDLLSVTGYIRGGCSPVGMKKQFVTVIDISAQSMETIYVSGGRIGLQIEIAPNDLIDVIHGRYAEITM